MLMETSEYSLHFGNKSFLGITHKLCGNHVIEPVAGGQRHVQTLTNTFWNFSNLFDFFLIFHILTWRISLSPLLTAKQMQLRLYHHHLSLPSLPTALALNQTPYRRYVKVSLYVQPCLSLPALQQHAFNMTSTCHPRF